ncbi:MAG: hypothetical protein JW798_07105 [Prolixibacteraceae bacterium]|nr:hypothetical protein [Prolixibacteraceae bacterium]
MKNKSKYFLIVFTIVFHITVSANPVYRSEKHNLQINKTLFVSGESIWFKNTLIERGTSNQSILYADICDEGKIIASRILLRENNHWQGDIGIPDSLQTGIYIFRVYTGNASGEPDVASMPVMVINRFGNNDTNEARKKKHSYEPLDLINFLPGKQGNALLIYASEKEYKTDENIEFMIEKNDVPMQSGVSFVVYKIPDSLNNIKTMPVEPVVEYRVGDNVKIFNKLTLSGQVLTAEGNEPVQDEMVYFSIPDSVPQINYARTDKKGEFNFQLDEYYGSKDVIIQTKSKEQQMNIIVYSNLLSPPVKIPYYIPEVVEKGSFAELAVKRAQLQKAYFSGNMIKAESAEEQYPFYGEPPFVVIPGRYIDLNNFEEIILELLPLCRIRKGKDISGLRIFDPVNTGYFDNPMMLVDGVPVHNISEMISLNSPKIRRIEIQPSVRCYGDLLIESALSVITTHGGFHDINLTPNAIRLNIETFYQPGEFPGNKPQPQKKFADFRDVLCWMPVIDNFKGITRVYVQSSHERGNYIALAQAVDTSGKVHRSVFQFTIN